MGKYKPSKYQQKIFDTFKHTNKNIVVSARPGSGKSTTIVELSKMSDNAMCMVAFNSSIVKELKTKVKVNVDVTTLHGLGMSSLIRVHGRLNVKEKKTSTFISRRLNTDWDCETKGEEGKHYMLIPPLVDAYRLTMCETKGDLIERASAMGVDVSNEFVDKALVIIEDLKRYNKNPKEVDFVDMVYLPTTSPKYSFKKYHVMFLDEAQDVSKCQFELFKKAKGRARSVIVGDENQAIYGFVGADSRSLSRFKRMSNTIELPLSICYRCPVKVVSHANKIYDNIESPEWAEMGTVKVGSVMDAKSGDLVICRNVAPLVDVFFKFMKAGKKSYIKGVDMGKGLISIIERYSSHNIDDMFARLFEDLKEIEGELISRGIQKPMNHPTWRSFQEKITIIDIISEVYSSVSGMIVGLKKMFEEEGSGVCLTSGHKSKGLEAENVYFLDSHLIPSQFATTEEQLIQEKNLKYVITTRAKSSLLYVYS